MSKNNKYYENTKNAMPHELTKRFIDMKISPSNAIDLGCGTGRDTLFLIKNRWNVLAIDKENTEEYIYDNLNDSEKSKFRFECQAFEDIDLEKNNLILANYSIPFCKKENFQRFWEKISDSILKDRIFCGKFLWFK